MKRTDGKPGMGENLEYCNHSQLHIGEVACTSVGRKYQLIMEVDQMRLDKIVI